MSISRCGDNRMPTIPLLNRSYFPHLMKEETEIFVRWLAKYEDLYLAFDFDIRVGEGAIPSSAVTDKIDAGFKHLTQKRIDVVGTQPEAITIFEVRPRATQTALGNLLGYATLYRDKFRPFKPVKLGVITDRISADDRAIMDSYNVDVYVV